MSFGEAASAFGSFIMDRLFSRPDGHQCRLSPVYRLVSATQG
jgi:hypothetical protein